MKTWLTKHGDDDDPAILDQAYLDRLSKHIGRRETRELMADGMIDLSDRLDMLAVLGQSGTAQEVGHLAHDIAGAAGHQGLTAMSRAAVEVTRLSHERSDMDPATLAEMILSLRQVSLDALSAYCQSDQPEDLNA